jgi:hypothetical protein
MSQSAWIMTRKKSKPIRISEQSKNQVKSNLSLQFNKEKEEEKKEKGNVSSKNNNIPAHQFNFINNTNVSMGEKFESSSPQNCEKGESLINLKQFVIESLRKKIIELEDEKITINNERTLYKNKNHSMRIQNMTNNKYIQNMSVEIEETKNKINELMRKNSVLHNNNIEINIQKDKLIDIIYNHHIEGINKEDIICGICHDSMIDNVVICKQCKKKICYGCRKKSKSKCPYCRSCMLINVPVDEDEVANEDEDQIILESTHENNNESTDSYGTFAVQDMENARHAILAAFPGGFTNNNNLIDGVDLARSNLYERPSPTDPPTITISPLRSPFIESKEKEDQKNEYVQEIE